MMSEKMEEVEDILRPLVEGGDPRFEVLRWPTAEMGYWRGVNASLGAIVRAAAACGESVVREVLWFTEDALNEGVAPEEAAAWALVAVVGDGKSHSATGPMQGKR